MKNYLFVVLLIVPLLNSCKKSSVPDKKPGNNVSKVSGGEGFVVKSAPLNNTLLVPGTLLPFETTELHPEVSGRLSFLNLKEGIKVPKAFLIAKINDEDLQASLKKLNVQLEIAKNQEKRQSELLKINAIGQADYDIAILNVKSLQSDIEYLKANIRKTEIRAPFDGVLGLRMVSPGAYVSPATIITSISQTNKLKLNFSVPEKYQSLLKLGAMVLVKVDGTAKSYQARIIATEPLVETDTRSLKVLAELNSPDSNLKPGMFAQVDLNIKSLKSAILVPSQAILAQAREKKIIQYKNGKAEFLTVTVGERQASDVEILDGLHTGDTILISGLLTIKPGATIKLTKLNKD